VPDLGTVTRVLDAPSCSVLELDDGTLIPFISDAIERVDLEGGEIQVRKGFLG
jgi:ribosomal 30S subunit maturation factor RimM